MPRLAFIALFGLFGLTGCVTTPRPAQELPPGPFTRPAGSSRSPHVGYFLPARPNDRLFTLTLAPGHGLRVGDTVVARGADLRATALLRIEQLQGRAGLASLRKGRPLPADEVVLPSSELTRIAEGLPAASPGS